MSMPKIQGWDLSRWASVFVSIIAICGVLGGAMPVASAAAPSKLQPCVVKGSHGKPKTTTKKEVLQPKTITQNNSSLAAGTTQQVQAGQPGTRTIYYTASYKKGKLVGCKHTGTKVTTSPVNAIVRVGTYAAPAPTASSGSSYTNVDGNQVPSPSSNPSGATAQCNDGTYSYSQNHSGTCSHHGGVASWL